MGFVGLNANYLLANLFAFLGWAWFGFEIQRVWVFKKKRSARTFVNYLINQFAFFGISTLLLLLSVETFGIRPELAYLLVTSLVAIGMYLASVFFVFGNNRKP